MWRSVFIGLSLGLILTCCSEPEEDSTPSSSGHAVRPVSIYDRELPKEAASVPENPLVLLTMGQSNAANFGETRNASTEAVYTYFNGKYYPANDPLLGSNGTGGSVWIILADSLINSGIAKSVVLVPIAYGPSQIEEWATGRLADTLKSTLHNLSMNDVDVDYVLWHQGESDNEAATSTETYIHHFQMIQHMLIDGGVNAPILMARASYLPVQQDPDSPPTDPDIIEAQQTLIKTHDQIFPGPYTDSLILPDLRFDGVHFSRKGLIKHAQLWLKSLRALNSHVDTSGNVVDR